MAPTTYYTISHEEEARRLGGDQMSRNEALAILRARADQTEWFVTEWCGDGSDEDELIEQTNAAEFVDTAEEEPIESKLLAAGIDPGCPLDH